MKRCAVFAALSVLCAVSLAGCGGVKVPDEVREPSIAVSGRGQIDAWLVEDFAEDYYSLSELSDMAVKEAEEFNGSSKNGRKAAVRVEKVSLLSDDSPKVVVRYRFDSWRSYTGFSDESLFYGTVDEALRRGYIGGAVLTDVTDGSPFSGESWKKALGRMLIVTNAKVNIYCPGRVTHVSGGARVNGDGSVDTRAAEGTVYILMQ